MYKVGLNAVPFNAGVEMTRPHAERDPAIAANQQYIRDFASANAGSGFSEGGGQSGGATLAQQMQMMKLAQDYMAPALQYAPKSQQLAIRAMATSLPAYAALQDQAKALLSQQSQQSRGWVDPYAGGQRMSPYAPQQQTQQQSLAQQLAPQQ